MKPHPYIRVLVIILVVLLCTGMGVYSFWCLNQEESRQDFNLYTLVPSDAQAVLETDYVEGMVNDISQLACSKDGHYLHVSDLFGHLKKYLDVLIEHSPHGLSTQMNHLLISFHRPDTPTGQVLYSDLGVGDCRLVEDFLNKVFSSTFSLKTFDYKGEQIRIYPMGDGTFLSVYLTEHFLVASFQKRLVEQVIDTYHHKRPSLARQPEFKSVYRSDKHTDASAVVYVKLDSVKMGAPDGCQMLANVGGWCEFDLQLDGSAVYCMGNGCESDSVCDSYVEAIRAQRPLEGFPNAYLPRSTYCYHCLAASDKEAISRYVVSVIDSCRVTREGRVDLPHEDWDAFWADYGAGSLMSVSFLPADTTGSLPCNVLVLPLKNELGAERQFRSLLYFLASGRMETQQGYLYYAGSRKLRTYTLRGNAVLTCLRNDISGVSSTSLCFYRGCLLMAADVRSLAAYVNSLEDKHAKKVGYMETEEFVALLSPLYNSLSVMDMEIVSTLHGKYVRMIPDFFLRHISFFRHFMIAIQFVCIEETVYPSVTLLYKQAD